MSTQPATDYIDKDGFRANVGIVLTRGSGEVFLGGRVGGRGWQFPQGGVNRGESGHRGPARNAEYVRIGQRVAQQYLHQDPGQGEQTADTEGIEGARQTQL